MPLQQKQPPQLCVPAGTAKSSKGMLLALNRSSVQLSGRTGHVLEPDRPSKSQWYTQSQPHIQWHRMNSLIETDHAGSIYTTKISKHYNKPECLCFLFIYLFWELVIKYLPVQHSSCKGSRKHSCQNFSSLSKNTKGKVERMPAHTSGNAPYSKLARVWNDIWLMMLQGHY